MNTLKKGTALPNFVDNITENLPDELPRTIDAAVILGSGLGGFTDYIEDPATVSYSNIAGMPETSVKGHEGQLVFGSVGGKKVLAFAGRFHHYEGYTFEETATPVYLAKALSAKKLIISNAAGAINTSFSVGDLMVIEDVIRGNQTISPKGYPRHRYQHYRWVKDIRNIAAGLGLVTQKGTYMYAKGPNYETKAEIRSFRRMGADAVGMSTAPELFEASRLGIKTAAISLITNMAAGVTKGKLSHDEVKSAADSRKEDFAQLVIALISQL